MEEIKAGDIMIGNYYHYQFNDKICKVESIVKDDNWHGGYKVISECGQITGIAACCPIPLTEDILLKAGAKKIEENNVVIMINDPSTHLILMKVGTHWYPQIEQTGEFISDGVNTVHLNFIDYVHQAQILFKSLTGNELEINL